MESRAVIITISGIDRNLYGDLNSFTILYDVEMLTKVEDTETKTYTVVLRDKDIWCSISPGGVFTIRKGLYSFNIPFNRIGELIVC